MADDNIKFLCDQEDPEDFMSRIVTGDETWVSTFEMEGKQATSLWSPKGAARPKKALPLRSQSKTMLTLFFDAKGMILCEFLGPRERVTAEHYIQTLANLKEALHRKRPDLWKDQKFWLHHDNASPHTAEPTVQKLHEWKINVLPHLPYSPDLAPCDFKLFPHLKNVLRGRRFRTVKLLQDATRQALLDIDKSVYSDAIHEMVARWQKCSAANGEYFEGDHVVIDPLFEKMPATQDSSDSD